MIQLSDALKSIGAITGAAFLPLERKVIYITGEAKTSKSSIAASFPGMLHVDFGGEAHAIPGRKGLYVYCPVWTKANLEELKHKAPHMWKRKDFPAPTCWETVREVLEQEASTEGSPVTGVIIDSGEQFQELAKVHLEEDVFRCATEEYRGGRGGHGQVNDLCRSELRVLSTMGLGRIFITHLRPEVVTEKTTQGTVTKTYWRSGVTPTLDAAMRDDADFIWLTERTQQRGAANALIQKFTLRTNIVTEQKTGLSTGNRVPMEDTIENIPQVGAYEKLISPSYWRGVEKLKAIAAANPPSQPKGAGA